MRSSIIEYSPTTTPTVHVRFIASRAAPANSSSSGYSHMTRNLLQAIVADYQLVVTLQPMCVFLYSKSIHAGEWSDVACESAVEGYICMTYRG